MAESERSRRLLKLASSLGARMFRNNTGMGWVGEVVERSANRLVLKNPRPFHAGLVKGGSDLIGWTPIVITQEMVGQKVAVFTAIEVKEPDGRLALEQGNFISVIGAAGGYAGIAIEDPDVKHILRRSDKPATTC